jgi:hypothetical protein
VSTAICLADRRVVRSKCFARGQVLLKARKHFAKCEADMKRQAMAISVIA